MKNQELLFGLLVAVAGALFAAPTCPFAGYEFDAAASDEFDGTSLDDARWDDWVWSFQGRRQGFLFARDNVAVADGFLRLTARALRADEKTVENRRRGFDKYATAIVKAKRKTHYGYYECRAKTMKACVCNAFWLYDPLSESPEKFRPGDFSEEIDIFEIFGAAGKDAKLSTPCLRTCYHTVHCLATPYLEATCNGGVEKLSAKTASPRFDFDFWADYHTFGFLWTERELVWFVDGKETFRRANDRFHRPMHVTFDCEVMFGWSGEPLASDLPAVYSVDYFRHWRSSPDQTRPRPAGRGAGVTAVSAAPVVDGKLDDACWRAAKWEGGFKGLTIYSEKPTAPKTEFALVADADALYVAVRCYDPDVSQLTKRRDTSLWVTDDIELYFCPSGRGFDIYHFAISPVSKDVCAEFLSEGGIIQPDPYAPVWKHAIGLGKDMWVAEFAFPLSAFYMTRNRDWKSTWLMNVARTTTNPERNPSRTSGNFGWAQLERIFLEPKNFVAYGGFPMRRAEDDLIVRTASARMEAKDADGVTGKLRLEIESVCAGAFEIAVSSAAKPVRAELKAGGNVVDVPCRYRENGRFKTHVAVKNLAANRTLERDYPVLVNFEPIAVRFTKPGYRANFYPGQDAGTVAGTLAVASGADAELTLEGPGFPTRTARIAGGTGAFRFDTKGFAHGEAYLTVKAGGESVRRRIRNLPPTGHKMAWIEDGHLVVDGKPVFRRSFYADGYMQGEYFLERFRKDRESFCLTKGFATGNVTLTSAEERGEAVFDRRPSDAVFARIDRIIEANRDKDIVGYYISDEPECRLISPIYLKHIYDHVAEKDPYRILFTASRGGKAYVDIADLIETHPYMDCQRPDAEGVRKYGTAPWDMPRSLDDFDAWNRPDKCLGFLPTCFAYRWTSVQSDYPTFDEYVAHCWAMLIAGSKTLWPYAGHDLGDREALYEGTRYVFRQAAAYEKFLLFGKHVRHPRKDMVDRGTWVLDGDTLDVTVDYKTMKTTIRVPEKYNATLESYETVRARVDRGEAARLGRDNQLRGRYDFVRIASTNIRGNFGGGLYKLIDGTHEMLARYDNGPKPYLDLAFREELTYDRVRVFGTGLGGMKVSVPDGAGGWREVATKTVTDGPHEWEVSLGAPVRAKGVRIAWAGQKSREICEIELPKMK